MSFSRTIRHTHYVSIRGPRAPYNLGYHGRLFGGRVVRTGSLDVSDDRSGLVVHELDANLGDTTTRTCRPQGTN